MAFPATRRPRAQRGAAAVIVALGLFFATVLVAAFVNRNLVFEQRSSANQLHSTQAFEAAEAGVEWALAQLNANRRIGPDCQVSGDASASSFRTRYLTFNKIDATFAPATYSKAGQSLPLLPACLHSNVGWTCSCPDNGAATIASIKNTGASVAFAVQFLPTSKVGVVRISSTGCSQLAGACSAGAMTVADATAKIDVAVGLIGGLRTVPVAAVTTRTTFDADTVEIGVANLDPATGIAIHAGSAIAAGHAHITTAAGGAIANALTANDTDMAAMTTDRFFASYFGLDKSTWKQQPAVTAVVCALDCGKSMANALNTEPNAALLWVDGDLNLTGPVVLGSAQRPVVIVASGEVRFEGAVALTGVVYGASMRWDKADATGFVHGALISESTYQGNGAPSIAYDKAVLRTLAGDSGSFARVSGSWRDF